MVDKEQEKPEEEEQEPEAFFGSRILGTVIKRVRSRFDNRIIGTQ